MTDEGPLNGLRIDARDMSRSLTGFDEIAIRKAFGDAFESLKGMFAGRSLVFVHFRRDGMKDADAHRRSLELTVGELEIIFRNDEDAEGNADGSTEIPTMI